MPQDEAAPPYGAYTLAVLLAFAALAKGAYDAWSAALFQLAALALFTGQLAAGALKRPPQGLRLSLWPLLVALLGALALSLAGAANPGEAFHAWRDWAAAALLFLAALNALADERSLDRLLACLVPVFVVEAVEVLRVQATGLFFREQPGGTLLNANALAAFLLLWLPLLAEKVRKTWSDPSTMRLYWRLGLAANLTALLLAYSTSAVLCVLAGIPLWLGTRKTAAFLRRRPRFGAAAVGFALVAAAALLGAKFSGARPLDRLGWWLAALRMFADHPWLGVGPGNFASAYLAYQAGAQHTRFAHGFPFTLLAETGLAGAGSLALLAGAWSLKLLARRPSPERLPCVWGLLLSLLFVSINFGMELQANLAAAAVLAAAALAPAARERWKPRPLAALLAFATVLFCVPYIAAPFLAGRNCEAARALADSGDLPAALRAYGAAASMDPLSAEARRGLAETSFELYRAAGDRRFLTEALRQQRRAAALDSLSGRRLWELYLYQKAAGEPEAEATLRRAARLDKGNPAIRAALESLKPS